MPPLQPRDYVRLHEFRYAIRSFLRFSEEAVRAEGLEPQQHQLLLAVRARGGERGLLIGEIAERLQIKHHSAVELADRAEAHGHVVRCHDEDDRRQVRVQLTAAGEAVLARLAAAHLAELRQAAPELSRVLASLLEGELATAGASR